MFPGLIDRVFSMKIIVNGNKREIHKNKNLEEFINSSFGKAEGIFVELNGKILTKEQRSEHTLEEGDVIEIIQFVGGG